MNVYYANEKVKKVLCDFPTLQKKCGKHALQIKRRIEQVKAFINLKEMMNSGLDNPHFKSNDLAGYIGWSVNQNVRILIRLDTKIDETLLKRLDEIKDITVEGVLDYHGGKKNWIIS